MNAAIAAVGPTLIRSASEANTPMVFVDGVPLHECAVVSMSHNGPLDRRSAVIAWSPESQDADSDFKRAEMVIAVPHALSDAETRWQALLAGRVSTIDRSERAQADTRLFTLYDRWSIRLDEPVDRVVAYDANATPRALLEAAAAAVDAELVIACDATELDDARRLIDGSRSLGDTLRAWLDDLNLALHQSLTFDDERVTRTLTVQPMRSGRRVALPWPDDAGRGGSVVSVRVDRETRPPRRWVARGDRPIVEDTLALQAGWDPTLEGRPDADYARTTSSDYSRFGAVYRTWVLNEDGAFDGARFDVGALFDTPGSVNAPLRFGDCLTRDSAGRRLPPIVESSTDSGQTWSAYPGQASVMNDRGGVQLNDDNLSSSILTAAKAGTLRLRITASLTHPTPIEATRWDGNPFAGPAPTREAAFDEAFAWRRVAPTSIHRASIDAGTLTADTADDRSVLRQRLLRHIDAQPGPSAVAELRLYGAWTAYRVGDRIDDALGRGIALDGNPSSLSPRDATIRRIDLTLGVTDGTPSTLLRLD
jgi:hypothetical protein